MFKRKEKEFVDEIHKKIIIETRKALRKDLFFSFLITLFILFLIYDKTTQKWFYFFGEYFIMFKFILGFLIFLLISKKEKNNLILIENEPNLIKYKAKLEEKKQNEI